MAARKRARAPKQPAGFDLQGFVDSAGLSRTITKYPKAAVIFSRGIPQPRSCTSSRATSSFRLSKTGKGAIVAMLSSGRRMSTATATSTTTVLVVEKAHMMQMLHSQPELADCFLVHMLARNIRIEEDLVDQLFNSSEKRLARALLLMARYGKEDKPQRVLHNVSQGTLAEIVGTTRSRVNFFMNKFRDLGFIEYNGKLKINSSLLSIVLHD